MNQTMRVKSQIPFEASFPCLNPDATPVIVPLPGVSYRFTIPKQQGLKILTGLNNGNKLQLKIDWKDNLPAMTGQLKGESRRLELSHSFSRFVDEFSLDSKGLELYACLLPSLDTDCSRGCIAVLERFSLESDLVVFVFKGLKRAIIKSPELNLKNQLWVSRVVVPKDDVELSYAWSQSAREVAAEQIQKGFAELTATLDEFRSRYKRSLQRKDGEFGSLLLMSPLANLLFIQLSRAQFTNSWEALNKSYNKLNTRKIEGQKFLNLFTLLDTTVSVLPTTESQRLRFLSLDDPSERLKDFIKLKEKLILLLSDLYNSARIAGSQLNGLTPQEKANFLALHLNALRDFLGLVRQSREGTMVSHRKDGEKVIMKSKSVEVNDDEDDFKAIEKFLEGLNENDIHSDGLNLLRKDLKRMKKMQPQSAEYQVLKNYFDVILEIPFKVRNKQVTNIDLNRSKEKLDSDHFGLKTVKKRLMEYLAVLKLGEAFEKSASQSRAPILLLVGPPGVGKTSVAKSVAEVLGRKFHRISLAGIYSEAEIRGHRRTYVGSMSGLIINALRKSGSMKPLVLLDEIDKVLSLTGGGRGASINGDPGAALLEVLDPEQNCSFTDHYVGFPVDLSHVLFFCTANDVAGISAPLLNRMEVTEIPGYTMEEKIEIGTKFLLPKQIRLNGLDKIEEAIILSKDAWSEIVSGYTREPGVRGLERKLAGIVRGKVVEFVQGTLNSRCETVTAKELVKYLGFPLHPISRDLIKQVKFADESGVVNGLAYNSDGTGGVLIFEVIKTGKLEGRENGPRIRTTGNLGKLLNESIEIAVALVKSLRERRIITGLSNDLFEDFVRSDLHLHVPMGAVSKDGPSAGVAITLALLSTVFKIPVPANLCMTGEITSRGKVLPIGGVKEKLLGARLFGMEKVLVPLSNRPDVIESVMEPEQFESCLAAAGKPELLTLKEEWHLELYYIDDLFDAIVYCWPHSFQSTGSRLLLAPLSSTLRAAL
ncbi:LANO_0E03510g1_1 [Lachancea nothofagi CBS 11611]|uniref:endopeptidase La n=1 Tax=Lachancea nothofagi CBS 11611 TaxID=1266666 RepID=A0A1G4JRJ5_9SACH|nr:LANO_0E03510g1_1 [Lachancea nothofagi CBS 11611]